MGTKEILKKEVAEFEVKAFARELIEFIDDCPSSYHVGDLCSEILVGNDFERLDPYSKWDLKLGGKYFVKKTNSTIVAFTIGEKIDLKRGFKIFGSHTDSPGFRIKPNPEMITNGVLRLNTEVYRGLSNQVFNIGPP